MANLIRRVTVVSTKTGEVQSLYDKRKKKRKVSQILRPTERLLRTAAKAEERCWTEFNRNHNKSLRKKRDRWITDGIGNAVDAAEESCKVWRRI
jgi:hypothetical protein